jgi:hypothetical protein
MAPTMTYAGLGLRTVRDNAAVYQCCSVRVTGDSRRSNGAPRSRISASAGVTVNATINEAATASA